MPKDSFLITDYKDRQIRLTDERLNHIVKKHSEMANMKLAIQDTLVNPDVVRKSRTDNSVYLYYKYFEGTVVGNKWLCTLVKYLENDAFVITAYLTDKLKQGEQVWPSL